MTTVNKTYVFAPAQVIKSAEANQNFDDLVNYTNAEVIVRDASKAFTAIPSGPGTDPTSPNQFTRKQYVDNADALRAKLDGTTPFTGIPSGPATNPTTANQFTRKQYVDDSAVTPLIARPTVSGLATNPIIKADAVFVPTTNAAGEADFGFITPFPNACQSVTVTADNGAGPCFVSITSKNTGGFRARIYTENIVSNPFTGGFSNARYVGAAILYYTAVGW
jgi:hypothetical protein